MVMLFVVIKFACVPNQSNFFVLFTDCILDYDFDNQEDSAQVKIF